MKENLFPSDEMEVAEKIVDRFETKKDFCLHRRRVEFTREREQIFAIIHKRTKFL